MSSTQRQRYGLSDLKRIAPKNNTRQFFNMPNTFGEEGEDHINISTRSISQLGRLLDPDYVKSFSYPHIGVFSSVMSLWYWLRSPDMDDSLRKMTGTTLRQYSRNNRLDQVYTPNFRVVIGIATWLKVKEYTNILNEIKKMPKDTVFLAYHHVNGSQVRMTNNSASIIVPIAEEIFRAVHEGREPDFSQMADRSHLSGLSYLHGALKRFMPETRIKNMIEAEKNALVEKPSEEVVKPPKKTKSTNRRTFAKNTDKQERGQVAPVEILDELGYHAESTPIAETEVVAQSSETQDVVVEVPVVELS